MGLEKSIFISVADLYKIALALCAWMQEDMLTRCVTTSKLFPDSPIQKQYRQPLETNDHPKLNVTAFCNKDKTEIYQSLIGFLEWAGSISRMDVQTAVMTMSSFWEQPQVSHLERLKRMVGFLASFWDYKIRFCTNEPDFRDVLPIPEHNWKYTPYGNPKKDLPMDAPPPRGNRVTLPHFFDVNLIHNVLSGKEITGVVHFGIKHPCIGTQRSKQHPKLLPMDLNFFLAVHVLNNPLIIETTFDTLEFQFTISALPEEITAKKQELAIGI